MPVFQTSQLIKTDLETCWEFFSNPANLAKITPPYMKFIITFPQPVPEMYQGMIIRYRVSPLLKIPTEWITEITHVSKPHYFVDIQLKGPYRIWHHQHFFEKTANGINLIDIVNYSLPLGILGDFVAGKLVRKKVESIFRYRSKIIDNVFNSGSVSH